MKETTDMKTWFGLPLSLRQRWWKETDYGKLEPSEELKRTITDAATGRTDALPTG